MGQHDETTDVSGGRDLLREDARRTEAREILKRAVGEVSINEKLLIWRRREGLSQRTAGALFGFARKKYGSIERDNDHKRVTCPHVGELYSYELCLILRKRSGWTISACAEQAGVSRYWYNLMELGKASPETLVQYWIDNEG